MRRKHVGMLASAIWVLVPALYLPAQSLQDSRVDVRRTFYALREERLRADPNQTRCPISILAKFKDEIPSQARAALRAEIGGQVVRTFSSVPNLEHIWIDCAVDTAIRRLNGDPAVLYAHHDARLRAPSNIPDDPSFGRQWALHNTGPSNNYAFCGGIGPAESDIDIVDVWDIITDSSSKVIALIDSGVNFAHPELAPNIWTNSGEIANGVDDDGNGFIDDIRGWNFFNDNNDIMDATGHGTSAAGVIGAVGNNGISVAGINWTCRIMSLRWAGPDGTGPGSAAYAAIDYAIQMRSSIACLEFVSTENPPRFLQAEYDLLNAARAAGILVVASPGNEGRNTDEIPQYPAGYNLSNIMVATGVSIADTLKYSWGPTSVDLGAPTPVYTTSSSGGIACFEGTSAAIPHVAGAAALLWAHNPTWTYAQVRQRIFETVRRVPDFENRTVTGGVLNVAGAFGIISNRLPVVTVVEPPESFDNYFYIDDLVTLRATVVDEDVGLDKSLVWSSNRQGVLGTGGSITISNLVEGQHSVTAAVTDSGGLSASRSVSISVFQHVPPRIYVASDAPSGGDGRTWESAFNSLSQAVGTGAAFHPLGGQIWIKAGTYVGGRDVSGGRRLYGGFAGWETELWQRDVRQHPTTLSGGDSPESIAIARNIQGTSFGKPVQLTLPFLAQGPQAAAAVDFNHDGLLDLAVANQTAETVSLHIADGKGGFDPPRSFDSDTFNPWGLAVADFTRDNEVDVVAYSTHGLTFLSGDGNGNLGGAVEIVTTGTPCKFSRLPTMAVTDFNDDGYLDLAVATQLSIDILLQAHSHNDVFELADVLDGFDGVIVGFLALHLDEDDKPDLAVIHDEALSTFEGRGSSFRRPWTLNLGFKPDSLVGGLFNDDLHTDLVFVESETGQLYISFGMSDLRFGPVAVLGGPLGARRLVVGDVNDDGIDDLLVAATGGVSPLLGNGMGDFSQQPVIDVGGDPEFFLLQDLTQDGGPDIVSLNRQTRSSFLLRMQDDRDLPLEVDGFTIAAGLANGSGVGSSSTVGGAVYIDTKEAGPIFRNCTFLENAAVNGGAVYIRSGTPVFDNCRFVGNFAADAGGAVLVAGGETSFRSCTFVGNEAVVSGGALAHVAGTSLLVNDTIVNNFASIGAGGVHISYDGLEATNSILWNNAVNGVKSESSQIDGLQASMHYCIIQGLDHYTGYQNLSIDPLFFDLNGIDDLEGTEDDNCVLLAGSPAIDAGGEEGNSLPPNDFDGHARILCGRVDIGAYESGFADADCDGDVDLKDIAGFQRCHGAAVDGKAGCHSYESNGSGVIEIGDFRQVAQLIRGP